MRVCPATNAVVETVVSRQYAYRKYRDCQGGWVFAVGEQVVSWFPKRRRGTDDDCIMEIQLFYHHGWEISTELGGVGGTEVFAQDGRTVRERFFSAVANIDALSTSSFHHFHMTRALPVALDLVHTFSATHDGTILLHEGPPPPCQRRSVLPSPERVFRYLCLFSLDQADAYVRLYPGHKKSMQQCKYAVRAWVGGLLHAYHNVHVHKTHTLHEILPMYAQAVTELHHTVFRARKENITFHRALHWFQYEQHPEDALFRLVTDL